MKRIDCLESLLLFRREEPLVIGTKFSEGLLQKQPKENIRCISELEFWNEKVESVGDVDGDAVDPGERLFGPDDAVNPGFGKNGC